MKKEIKKILEKALKNLGYEIDEVVVDYPKKSDFGDYTSNVAMVLSKIINKNPLEVAEEIIREIEKISAKDEPAFGWEVVKPGYINSYLSKKYLQNLVGEINKLGNKFGGSEIGAGIKINNEFISANPTGPLHLGNGRGGFLGDVLGNILKKNGYRVEKEYYVNDAGEQIIKLGHSILKDGEAVYAGDYIDYVAEKISKKDSSPSVIGSSASDIILTDIIKPTILEKMKIEMNSYISEKKDIVEKGYVEKAIEKLEKDELVFGKDGAVWLKTKEFGDDKDRVLIKKDGQKTYFASDCGYILYKIEKGFEKIIEIWGADHHGYISRFRAAAEALGFKGELKFIIVQLVRLMKDGKEARMSKRAGNIVYIDELIDEVGLDAVRFFFLMYSADTHMTFDLNLAKERSEKNPVYYIQYAHARICSILEKSKELKIKKTGNLELLTHEKELNLIRELNKFPEIIENISKSYEVHKLPYYVLSVSDKFHSFYNDCVVIDEKNPELTNARLKLVDAVRITIREALRILGVNAPNKM